MDSGAKLTGKQPDRELAVSSAFRASIRHRMQVQIAGEVADFDEEQWVMPKDRPHISRAALMAIAATSEALEDAGLEPQSMTRDRTAANRRVYGLGWLRAGLDGRTISFLLRRPAKAVQRVRHSHFNAWHAGK